MISLLKKRKKTNKETKKQKQSKLNLKPRTYGLTTKKDLQGFTTKNRHNKTGQTLHLKKFTKFICLP